MEVAMTQQVQGPMPFEVLSGLIGQLGMPELRALQGMLEQRIRQQEQRQGSARWEVPTVTPAAPGVVAEQVGEAYLARAATERGQRMIVEAESSQPTIQAAFEKLLAQWGIAAKPVSPVVLREMMRECGVREEDNLFSRGILEMREE